MDRINAIFLDETFRKPSGLVTIRSSPCSPPFFSLHADSPGSGWLRSVEVQATHRLLRSYFRVSGVSPSFRTAHDPRSARPGVFQLKRSFKLMKTITGINELPKAQLRMRLPKPGSPRLKQLQPQ